MRAGAARNPSRRDRPPSPGQSECSLVWSLPALLDRLFHPPSSHSRTWSIADVALSLSLESSAVTELSMRRRYLAARNRIVTVRVAWVRLRAPSRLDGPAVESERGTLPVCCLIAAKDAGTARCPSGTIGRRRSGTGSPRNSRARQWDPCSAESPSEHARGRLVAHASVLRTAVPSGCP